MVEITTAKYIITGFVFLFHICTQHTDLCFANRITVAVSRHVQQEDNQFLPVIYRNFGNAVTAVKVKELAEACRYRKASSQRIRNRIFGEKSKSGTAATMRLCEWIKKECGIVILCKYRIVTWNRIL